MNGFYKYVVSWSQTWTGPNVQIWCWTVCFYCFWLSFAVYTALRKSPWRFWLHWCIDAYVLKLTLVVKLWVPQ